MSNRCNGLNRKCASAIQTSDTRRTPQTIDAYRAAIDDYATSSQTIQVVQVINGRHASGASHDYRAAQPATRPRWLTRADQAAWADAGRASCVAATHGAWNAFAGIAGLAPQHFAGAQLLADRDGWLRAESKPGDASWANATLLCTAAGTGTAGAGNDNDQGNPDNSQNDHENSNESSNPGESGQPATAKPTAKSGTEKPGLDPLTALLLKIDAEPVRYVKGGFVH